ncbi:hypothetical protein PHYSODRAFT_306464 [Phytophthora sojae]|uniref:RxLR effector protein n=1 Tax=Phytophthora sojae (strain P6497) TaxID=1094619 RepID=G5AB81_PHYSP|nr:hypothetical protein PHYSODRAFT_306464 [Phytophthora sojae]EGZ07226.1 hypothetical protein PHYSODRAFT_306464 [Phytophthora sojae]|eukprot:XP_009536792.1 hypothetical protein PHYSODRAFT_306464 [Phytophthora sojae]
MRTQLWVLLVALVTLLANTAMVSAKSATSDLGQTSGSSSMTSMDQVRALRSLRQLRRDVPGGTSDLEGIKTVNEAITAGEERGFSDGVSRNFFARSPLIDQKPRAKLKPFTKWKLAFSKWQTRYWV